MNFNLDAIDLMTTPEIKEITEGLKLELILFVR